MFSWPRIQFLMSSFSRLIACLTFAVLSLCSVASADDLQIALLPLSESKLSCGLLEGGDTELLSLGFKKLGFKKTLKRKKRKLQAAKERRAVYFLSSLAKKAKKEKKKIGRLRTEVRFVRRCRRGELEFNLFPQSPTPSVSPTVSPSEDPSVSPTASATPSESPSPSVSSSPSSSPSPSPSASASPSPNESPSPSPSNSPEPSASPSPSASASSSPTASPSASPTPHLGNEAFQNFESLAVHPIEFDSKKERLYSVNLADSRLEILAWDGAKLTSVSSVMTGFDPVSVRLRTDSEAWVVNHISNTIAIVDTDSFEVAKLLQTAEGPADVAFSKGRAFVTSMVENLLQVFDLSDLAAEPIELPLRGMMPRMLEVDAQGVVHGVHQFTTDTALVTRLGVNQQISPYTGENPVPNTENGFSPEIGPQLPQPPEVGQIVKRDENGAFLDENGADWSNFVLIAPEDNDLFSIDAETLELSYRELDFSTTSALSIHPSGGLSVVGAVARNEVSFEPNLKGNFVRYQHAHVKDSDAAIYFDLNPHLDFSKELIEQQASSATSSQELREKGLAQPAAVLWSEDGSRAFVLGRDSGRLIELNQDGARSEKAALSVGLGASGLALDNSKLLVHSLNSNSILTVDISNWSIESELSLHDPTPEEIKLGRPFLYDTVRTSGLGLFSCATCHVGAGTDFLNWNLGNPQGDMVTITEKCLVPPEQGGCEFHPMKGPLLTQHLQDIIGTEPFHWRGDKNNISEFNPAFTELLGNDRELTEEEMGLFSAFLETVRVRPNANRNKDDSTRESLLGTDPSRGEEIFMNSCDSCHTLSKGGKGLIVRNMSAENNPATDLFFDSPQTIARVDTVRVRLGVESVVNSPNGRSAIPIGFLHDGGIDADFLFRGFLGPLIRLGAGLTVEEVEANPNLQRQAENDLIGFVASFPTKAHAGVGASMLWSPSAVAQELSFNELLLATESGDMRLVAKRRLSSGHEAGFVIDTKTVLPDDGSGPMSLEAFKTSFAAEQFFLMLVPEKASLRMGIDRELDGLPDGQ